MRQHYFFAAIALATALIAFVTANFTYSYLVDGQNRAELKELSEQTITRAEVAIDRSVISLLSLSATVGLRCDNAFVTEVRKKVFSVGSLKDIYFLNESSKCSGFPELGPGAEFDFNHLKRVEARNDAFTFAPIKTLNWSGLGVSRSFNKDGELLAFMTVDSLLFDMLPASLRDHASMELSVKGGERFAEYHPEGWNRNPASERSAFTASSQRYPVVARIVVNDQHLAVWNRDVPTIVVLLVAAISILFGFLTAKSFIRPRGMAEELDRAIENAEVVPFFQPIVSLSKQRIVGCEMLARWIKPDGTHVSPGRFIPVAELSGRADKLMHALLLQAGSSLGPLLQANDDLKLTVNATPEQFLSDGFARQTIELSKMAGLPTTQLFIEITERQPLESVEQANAVAHELAKAGIRVAIDDAGTGHNGLASIQSLEAACLKIDKLFIDHVHEDPRSRTMIEMLAKLGRDFGMTIVAEGIEQPEQAAALLSLGVPEGQGFLYSKPLPAEDFLDLVMTGLDQAPLDADSNRYTQSQSAKNPEQTQNRLSA